MKAHEKLPTLDEIKDFNTMLRNVECRNPACIHRQTDKDELQAKLEDAESEVDRFLLMTLDGAEALVRERENSTRIKRESDAVREENQKIRDRIGFERDLTKRAQAEVRRLRNLIREFFAQDESFEVREALRKAVE